MISKLFICYASPSGSTRHAARMIKDALSDAAREIFVLDIGSSHNRIAFLKALQAAEKTDCLFVGSPVYRDVAVPPVMELVAALPRVENVPTAPFVTWGGVTSGIALWQMGRALQKKGFVLAGASAVVAEHSMMWRSQKPMGAGRPDAEDDRKVKAWARAIAERIGKGGLAPLPLKSLDYQPRLLAEEMRQKIGQPWQNIPKTVDAEKCTQCGICVEECPVAAVTLDPTPVFDGACFDCFNCVRLCPEEAIDSPATAAAIEQHIAQLKEKYDETPETKVFLGS